MIHNVRGYYHCQCTPLQVGQTHLNVALIKFMPVHILYHIMRKNMEITYKPKRNLSILLKYTFTHTIWHTRTENENLLLDPRYKDTNSKWLTSIVVQNWKFEPPPTKQILFCCCVPFRIQNIHFNMWWMNQWYSAESMYNISLSSGLMRH